MENKSGNNVSGIPGYSLGRGVLIKRLGYYGFVECAEMVNFLRLVCHGDPDVCELMYLRDKLSLLLMQHDNRSDYFEDLRQLRMDINDKIFYMLSSEC